MALVKPQDQVFHRKSMANGNVLVRNGNVLAVSEDGSKAQVNFPLPNYTTEWFATDELELSSNRFGAVRPPMMAGQRLLTKS